MSLRDLFLKFWHWKENKPCLAYRWHWNDTQKEVDE
jgi:hypothetical protein